MLSVGVFLAAPVILDLHDAVAAGAIGAALALAPIFSIKAYRTRRARGGVAGVAAAADPRSRRRGARAHGAEVVSDVHVNPNAKQRELWLRDPDCYTVVLVGESEYRLRRGNT